MNGRLVRTYFPHSTKGELVLDGGFKCLTLELPWKNNEKQLSCIPEGVYKVVRRHSKKYGWHLHITDVKDRSLILIHWGNYAGSRNPNTGYPDILGCVLVGLAYADLNGDGIPEITRSKDAFSALMKHAPDGFVLEVVDKAKLTVPTGATKQA